MSVSWEGFLYAVEQMRVSQQEHYKRESPSWRDAPRGWELLVDEYVQEKRAELAREIQPQLI